MFFRLTYATLLYRKPCFSCLVYQFVLVFCLMVWKWILNRYTDSHFINFFVSLVEFFKLLFAPCLLKIIILVFFMFSSRPQLQQFFSKILILFYSSFCESEKIAKSSAKINELVFASPNFNFSLFPMLVSAKNYAKSFKVSQKILHLVCHPV